MLTPLDPPYGLILNIVAFAGTILLAALGGALASKGWRGRVESWAPTCARCGFDLRARTADLPASCPECGRPLAGAVVPGPRRMHRGAVALGAVLVAIAAALSIAYLFRLPTRVNAWILSMRPIGSFDRALDANDARAWRHLTDRVRLGRMDAGECAQLLDRAIARAAAAKQWTPADEPVIAALAQSPARPADLERRIVEATLALPTPVTARVVGEGPIVGRPFGIAAEAGRVPQMARIPLELRIVGATLEDGTAIEPFPGPSSASEREWRNHVSTSLFRAPVQPGSKVAQVDVEIRMAPQGADQVVNPGGREDAQPRAPDSAAPDAPATEAETNASSTPRPRSGDSAPLQRRFTIPVPFTVRPAQTSP